VLTLVDIRWHQGLQFCPTQLVVTLSVLRLDCCNYFHRFICICNGTISPREERCYRFHLRSLIT